MVVPITPQLHILEMNKSLCIGGCLWLYPINQHCSLLDWLDQSADWGTEVGQTCQTCVCVCLHGDQYALHYLKLTPPFPEL